MQHPQAVLQYISKEIALGAMLGPFHETPSPYFHCSPLLTRPKDGNKCRVILDLSYPNDKVEKLKFDGSDFDLKFLSIDNIVDRINCVKGEVRLTKVDVARAFRNLRVDPADALKLGIRWKGDYFLDGSAAFGWIHGSAAFQLLSNAIVFIMSQKGYHMFAYIDDYILVNEIGDAEQAFDSLVDLLNELGVPINQDKRSPPL